MAVNDGGSRLLVGSTSTSNVAAGEEDACQLDAPTSTLRFRACNTNGPFRAERADPAEVDLLRKYDGEIRTEMDDFVTANY
ncbi:MAG: hypothetical protein ACRDJL_00410 [Actinomycetota bacterium]